MISKSTIWGKLAFSVFAAGSFSALFASTATAPPACVAGTVASYISSTATPSGGCSIGILDYYNMAYIAGSNAPAASAINISLNTGGNGFSFGPVSAAAGQTVQFEIDYTIFIDPAPIITGDSLGLDVTGDITVSEFFCNDLPYNIGSGLSGAGTCLPSSAAPELQVGNGNGLPATNSITFNSPATKFQEVGIVFTLVGGTGGASFDGLNTASVVTSIPEPASLGFALMGFVTLAGGYKLRKRHNREIE